MYFWVSRAAVRFAAESNRNQSLKYITFVVTVYIFYSRSWTISYVSKNAVFILKPCSFFCAFNNVCVLMSYSLLQKDFFYIINLG